MKAARIHDIFHLVWQFGFVAALMWLLSTMEWEQIKPVVCVGAMFALNYFDRMYALDKLREDLRQ